MATKELNRTEALKMDTGFYADDDDEFNIWGVYGDKSGFCYASFYQPEEAEDEVERMNKRLLA